MIHTDGRRTAANASPSALRKPAHGGYPGTVTVRNPAMEVCAGTGVRVPECSCRPCLERLYALHAPAEVRDR